MNSSLRAWQPVGAALLLVGAALAGAALATANPETNHSRDASDASDAHGAWGP